MTATVIHLHVPKAAGTTLGHLLQRHCDGFYRIPADRADPRGMGEFRAMDDATRRRIDLLTGHIPYGVHRELPQECRYMTFLRDPIERAVSEHAYIRSHLRHPLHAVAASAPLASDFVASGAAAQLDNCQTRLLAGGMAIGTQPLDRPVEDQDLRRALRNLESFDFVGIVDRFDESVVAMNHVFGWRARGYPVLNTRGGGGPRLSQDERRIVAEQVRFDQLLVERGRELFEDRFSPLVTPGRLLTQRVLNVGYGVVRRLATSVT